MKGKQLIYVKKPRSIALWGLEYTQISKKMFLVRKQGYPCGTHLLLRIFSHPDFHCRSRTYTGSAAEQSSCGSRTSAACCCHRRSGIAPCPEDRIDLVCHFIIPAFHAFATPMLTGPMDSGFLRLSGLSRILPAGRFPAG